MPYIKEERRKDLDKYDLVPRDPGELNYTIIQDILEYLGLKDELHYADYNEVIGVLECVKQELYRRLIAPYEDKKKEENGDVF